MKRFENIFRILAMLLMAFAVNGKLSAQDGNDERLQLVEVGLLTCSPHNEVYSLYGHSALHLHDLLTGEHRVYNYGVFDFNKPHFVWRFIMGQTDYRLECTNLFNGFCDYYRKWGSKVEEQILDLTPGEKQRLIQALNANVRNPVYRYNFFYDNCSTRPRNIIEQCLDGDIEYADRNEHPTYRELIHACTRQHRWAAFGNDLLLGFNADRQTTLREQQFLPRLLMQDFEHATVERHGEKRPLLLRHVVHVPQGPQPLDGGFPLSPRACTLLLLLASLAIAAYEWRSHRIQAWWDAMLMLATGVAGCILTVMLFSEHPATSTNLQILLLNPLALFFIPTVVRHRKSRWFSIHLILLLLFFIGGIWQDYAEGMEIVALCLLLRIWIHRNDK